MLLCTELSPSGSRLDGRRRRTRGPGAGWEVRAMSDIFLKYASADRDRAQRIAAVLEDQGWSVWWDRTIPARQHVR
jgi:hypothetical protein